MIRGDILHAKTSQVSVEHQREVSSLGRIQERESRARSDVQRREQKFWREISQAATAKVEAPSRQGAGAPGAPLARALEAHRLLREAQAQHQGVSQELRTQVSKVMRTKFAIDTFSKMRQKHHLKCEYRRAERVSEQVDEVLSAQRSGRDGARLRLAKTQPGDMRDVSVMSENQPPVDPQSPPKGVDVAPRLLVSEPVPTKCVESSVHLVDTLSLQTIRFDAQPASHTLTVNVEHNGAPLLCRLAAAPSGEVGIVVGTMHGKLSEHLERHRPGIVNKLTELGIKVSSLQVRREPVIENSDGGSLRRGRRSQEENDENIIA